METIGRLNWLGSARLCLLALKSISVHLQQLGKRGQLHEVWPEELEAGVEGLHGLRLLNAILREQSEVRLLFLFSRPTSFARIKVPWVTCTVEA